MDTRCFCPPKSIKERIQEMDRAAHILPDRCPPR